MLVGNSLKITNQAAVSSWKSGVNYRVGDLVTYGGQTYKCLIAHTSHDGWKPSSATYSVWQKVSSSSTTTAPTQKPNGRKTIAKKCELVKSNKLGGIMIWDLGQDTTNSYSLLKVIKETLYGSNGKAPR